MDIEEAVAVLEARARRALADGDPEAITGPEGRAAADTLHALLFGGDRKHAGAYADGVDRLFVVLGGFHWTRYLVLRQEGLEESGEALDAALVAFAPVFLGGGDGIPEPLGPVLADMCEPVAADMLERALAERDFGQLSLALSGWAAITAATPDGDPGRVARLRRYGRALATAFMATGDDALLDRAVETGRALVAAMPDGSPEQAVELDDLASVLRFRHEHRGAQADFDEALSCVRAAVTSAAHAEPRQRARILSNLGSALCARFAEQGRPDDLSEGVAALREAVTLIRNTPADDEDPLRHELAANLAMALSTQFERTGALPALDEAIGLLRDSLAASGAADADKRALYEAELASALARRFTYTGRRADLDEAIGSYRAAAAESAGRPRHFEDLMGLGQTLTLRFDVTGSPDDLDEAVTCTERAAEAAPEGHPERATVLANAAGALLKRAARTGSRHDLDRAVSTSRAAVAATGPAHPRRAARLSLLCYALCARSEATGDAADLTEAVETGRLACAAATPGDVFRSQCETNLGLALLTRYGRTRELPDLTETTERFRTAVAILPPEHGDRGRCLNNLVNALQERYVRTRELADLDEAIATAEAAVRAMPHGHPDHAGARSKLGQVLLVRHGALLLAGAPDADADLDAAVGHLTAAVAATPDDHSRKARRLSALSQALRDRHGRTGSPADLDGAVDAARASVAASRPEHPHHASHRLALGTVLTTRFQDGRRAGTWREADRRDAVDELLAAWESDLATPSVRAKAAQWAARLLPADGGDAGTGAADLLEAAVRMLPEISPRQLRRGDQQFGLGLFTGLAGEAAAAVLAGTEGTEQGRAARALGLLDAGRAVLLSQSMDSRSDLTDLRRVRPDLAERFTGLRDALDTPGADDLRAAEPGPVPATPDLRDRARTAEAFAATLAEIRTVEGFTGFGLPPTTDELLAEAHSGHVVVLNVSERRSDALLLTASGISSVPLPELTVGAVRERTSRFHQAVRAAVSGQDRAARTAAQRTVTGTLEWLWDCAAGPVLDALGLDGVPDPGAAWPRVWWVPGGPLSRLPLHAAGHHGDRGTAEAAPRTVMDRVVSSYTPTVRALRYARQQEPRAAAPVAGPEGADASTLVVVMPATPGLPGGGRLPHAQAEADAVARHAHRPRLLLPPRATRAEVLAHLPTCAVAHFVCHGHVDAADPSHSRLLLHDHETAPLTVADLGAVSLGRARLAYLSACRTASGETPELADESIHLTSACQLAGFPHVIGTLWDIDDATSAQAAAGFYAHLKENGSDTTGLATDRAAHALHHAVRALRDGTDLPGALDRRRTPTLWAAYLHAGA